MTPKDIAGMLAQQMENVCRELLPAGKVNGSSWLVGSIDGEAGRSVDIELHGLRAGLWLDRSNGEHCGDALDLWAQARGCSIKDAIAQAKSFLGISEVPLNSFGHYKTQHQKLVVPKRTDTGEAIDYLLGRGFTEETIKALKLKNCTEHDSGLLLFPYLKSATDTAAFAISRANPKKPDRGQLSAGSKPGVFGWQAIPDYAREVVLVDSEMDAVVMKEYDFDVLAAPDGEEWIEPEYDNFERFDTIYVCMRSDESGRIRAKRIIERLGRERCKYMRLPKPTVMECFNEGLPPSEIRAAMRLAVSYAPAGIMSGREIGGHMRAALSAKRGTEDGTNITLPWGESSQLLVFRPSELVIVNGISGHGKSMFLGHLMLDGMRQGHKWMLASPEMTMMQLADRLMSQISGMAEPSEEYADAMAEWCEGKLWFYDVREQLTQKLLLETMMYASRKYNVKAFVVDSLMKCGIREDDYPGQKAFVDRLCDFKRETDSTVFLVTHSKKLENEKATPGKYDVAGAAGITNLADTGFSVWRRKSDSDSEDYYDGPNCTIDGWKQRNGTGWEGKLYYFFDPDSRQYLKTSADRPRSYVQYSALQAAS